MNNYLNRSGSMRKQVQVSSIGIQFQQLKDQINPQSIIRVQEINKINCEHQKSKNFTVSYQQISLPGYNQINSQYLKNNTTVSQFEREVKQIDVLKFMKQLVLKDGEINILNQKNLSLNHSLIEFRLICEKYQQEKMFMLQQKSMNLFEINQLKSRIKILQQKLFVVQKHALQKQAQVSSSVVLNLQRKSSQIKQRETFQQIIKDFNEAIQALQRQNNVLKESIINHNIQISNFQSNITQLQEQKAIQLIANQKLKNFISNLETQITELKLKQQKQLYNSNVLQDSSMDNSKLQSQISTNLSALKQNDFTTLQVQLNKLKQKLQFCLIQIQTLKERNQELIKENTEIKISIGKVLQKTSFSQEFNQQYSQSSIKYQLWSPRGCDFKLFRSNSYVKSLSDKLSETIFKNHFQLQKYKQRNFQLEQELFILKYQYNEKSGNLYFIESQLKQKIVIHSAQIRNNQLKHRYEIENLNIQIQSLNKQLKASMSSNKKKNQQIQQKQCLLQRWVSHKNIHATNR